MDGQLEQSNILSMQQIGQRARHYSAAELAVALQDARQRLLALVEDLTDRQWNVPFRPGVNPVAWEIGHVAWFAQWWTLRGPHHVNDAGEIVAQSSARPGAPDALFDSSRIAHAQRWQVSLPSRAQVLDLLHTQLEETLHALAAQSHNDASLYFHRLSLFHEDMHCEALIWLRAVLEYPAPACAALPQLKGAAVRVEIPAQEILLGHAHSAQGFCFDNEQPGMYARLEAFDVDIRPVSCREFLRFVLAGGYDNATYWPDAAGHWRANAGRSHPQSWRHSNGVWQLRWFDRWIALPEDAPLMHVNAYEAQAYCLWAGRRLPTAPEWEAAARSRTIDWGGGVWEWTASAFMPYPGFAPGPYRDYSQPWFGTHRELRGGSFATRARLHHASYRNFFTPERSDVFAGFRTCSCTTV
jgi:ergothioneine biosynthesis protein EgtB